MTKTIVIYSVTAVLILDIPNSICPLPLFLYRNPLQLPELLPAPHL